MRLDLGRVPHEPTTAVLARVSSLINPGKLARSPEDTKDVPGYMGATEVTQLPHVLHDGKLYFPNAFLARLHFLVVNTDIESCEMEWMATVKQEVLEGWQFFRFERRVTK